MEYANERGRLEEEVNEHGAPAAPARGRARAALIVSRRLAGVTVYVESRALMHIVGTEMDFVTVSRSTPTPAPASPLQSTCATRLTRACRLQDDLTSEFVFHNPNAEGSCGCGESFTTGKT
jgi:hypothetical protein